MTDVTLAEYAAKHGKAVVTVRQLAQRGSLTTARKVGRDWMVDENEPYPDNRRKNAVDFEMRRGLYVVDEIASPANSVTAMYVRIGENWYRKPQSFLGISPSNPAPIPLPGNPFRTEVDKYEESWLTAVNAYGCIPRDTDFIRKSAKRAATQDEIKDFEEHYKAVRLGERAMPLGRLWGPEYVLMTREIVYELDTAKAMRAEDEFDAKGVGASCTGPKRFAIRIA